MATPKKFIPNGDGDFLLMARPFAAALGRRPATFEIDPDEAAAMGAAVQRFEAALLEARGGTLRGNSGGTSGGRSLSRTLTLRKDEARKEAEKLIRRVAGLVRANDRIPASDKAQLGIEPRKKAGQARQAAKRAAEACGGALGEAPLLRFERAIHRSGGVPEHELRFFRQAGAGKPAGAARLELFFELVPPDDAVPRVPGGSGYGCHYLRSFVKSPVLLRPPLADRAMRVVYWARWADATGEVGPMSAAAAGWVEGGSHHLMAFAPTEKRKGGVMDVAADRLAATAARLPRLRDVAFITDAAKTLDVEAA